MKLNLYNQITFKKFEDGEVIAIWPYIRFNDNSLQSYMHVGQHGGCSEDLLTELDNASREEFTPLLTELKNLGYEDLVYIGNK